MSLVNKSYDIPSSIRLSTTFITQVESESVSTFGNTSPHKSSPVGKPSQATIAYTPNTDEITAISEMTLDSRVLKIENKFDNIERLLHTLVDRTKIDAQASPPDISIYTLSEILLRQTSIERARRHARKLVNRYLPNL